MQYLHERLNLLCAEAAYTPKMEGTERPHICEGNTRMQLFVPKDSRPSFLIVVNFMEDPFESLGEDPCDHKIVIEQHLRAAQSEENMKGICHGWTMLLSLRKKYSLAALLAFGKMVQADLILHTLVVVAVVGVEYYYYLRSYPTLGSAQHAPIG